MVCDSLFECRNVPANRRRHRLSSDTEDWHTRGQRREDVFRWHVACCWQAPHRPKSQRHRSESIPDRRTRAAMADGSTPPLGKHKLNGPLTITLFSELPQMAFTDFGLRTRHIRTPNRQSNRWSLKPVSHREHFRISNPLLSERIDQWNNLPRCRPSRCRRFRGPQSEPPLDDLCFQLFALGLSSFSLCFSCAGLLAGAIHSSRIVGRTTTTSGSTTTNLRCK